MGSGLPTPGNLPDPKFSGVTDSRLPLLSGPDADPAEIAQLAARLDLEPIAPDQIGPGLHGCLAVVLHSRGLGLTRVGETSPPLTAAFERRSGRGAPGAPSLVEKALGIPRGIREVVDATCGLGRDAASLWAALCLRRSGSLTLIERDPILHALLEYSIAGAIRGADTAPEPPQLQLLHGSAEELLPRLSQRPEAILLDPMFEAHRKKALPKRDLQLLQELLGAPDPGEASRLLEIAREVATRRVVVKRGPKDPPLADSVQSTHRGRSLRFDVYAASG